MAEIVMFNNVSSYATLVRQVAERGTRVKVRGEWTRELVGASLRYVSPYAPMLPHATTRRVNQKLAAVEALSLLAGTAERDLTLAAAPSYSKVLVSQSPADFEHAAYGPRLDRSLQTVVDKLVEDPTTRQAVLSIWRQDDLDHDGDKPCTLSVQFLYRHNQLHMIVTMRSNDVWLGLAYDAFVFNQLHLTVTNELTHRTGVEVKPLNYYHQPASLHLYERNVEAALDLTTTAGTNTSPWPRGVVPLDGLSFAETATTLLHPNAATLYGINEVTRLNPWYARQMTSVYTALEAVKP